MRKNIHPNYVDSTIKCACGATFKARSLQPEINVEICSKCHPFYTGDNLRTRTAGKVDKFNKKYGFDKK